MIDAQGRRSSPAVTLDPWEQELFDTCFSEPEARRVCHKGGGGGGTTTVEKADPWEGQQPYLTGLPGEGAFSDVDVPGLFPEAARLYEDNPLQFYGGRTFADFAPETQAALGLQTNRALQGSQLNQGAQGLASDTLEGNYLYANPANPVFAQAAQGGLTNDQLGGLQETASGQFLDAEQNPYLAPQAERLLANVLPRITSQYAGMGRQNSGLAARAASEGATDALGGLWMDNYNRERGNQLAAQQDLAGYGESGLGRQLAGAGALGDIYGRERANQVQAMGAAPGLSELDYQDIARLQEVGSVREDLTQQGINEAMQRFQFENMQPWDQLGLYNQMIQGTYGGTTTQTQQQPRRSLGQGLLGGAVAGGNLGYRAGGQTGALLGAGLGGLLGAF
jgi:hypothetical protein